MKVFSKISSGDIWIRQPLGSWRMQVITYYNGSGEFALNLSQIITLMLMQPYTKLGSDSQEDGQTGEESGEAREMRLATQAN